MQKMLLDSPTLVFVTKNKNYFVIQYLMHNLIISNVLDEDSDAKKHIGSKEKLAFAEFKACQTQNRSQAKYENQLHTFCHNILCHTESLLFTCKFFNVEKAGV